MQDNTKNKGKETNEIVSIKKMKYLCIVIRKKHRQGADSCSEKAR